MIEITVDVEPKAKKRPKVFRWSTVNPSKADEEELAQAVFNHKNCPKIPLNGQIRVRLKFYKKPSKGTAKWKLPYMESGIIRPNINPDLDNYVKLALDALNEILWEDDRYIVECHAAKYFSQRPRIELFIDQIPEIKYKKDLEILKPESEDLNNFFD